MLPPLPRPPAALALLLRRPPPLPRWVVVFSFVLIFRIGCRFCCEIYYLLGGSKRAPTSCDGAVIQKKTRRTLRALPSEKKNRLHLRHSSLGRSFRASNFDLNCSLRTLALAIRRRCLEWSCATRSHGGRNRSSILCLQPYAFSKERESIQKKKKNSESTGGPLSYYYGFFWLLALLLLLVELSLSWLVEREVRGASSSSSSFFPLSPRLPPSSTSSKKKKNLPPLNRARAAPTPPSPRSPPSSPSGTTSSRRRTRTRSSRSTPRRACCCRRCPTLPG